MLVRARPFLNIGDTFVILNSEKEENEASIREFENAFSKVIGVERSFAVDQGRKALLIALKSINITPGDEVIVQSLICQAVIDMILQLKAVPVLVDSSLDDFNQSISDIERKITSRTKAIIATHLYGNPADIEAIQQLARKNYIYIIEDCAHAVKAFYHDKNIGRFGDLAFFSFNFDKPISTGNGGMLIANNPALIEKVQNILAHSKRVAIDQERKELYAFVLQHCLMEDRFYKRFLPFHFTMRLINNNGSIFEEIRNIVKEQNLNRLENLVLKINKSILKHNIIIKLNKLRKKKSSSSAVLMNSLRSQIGLRNLGELEKVEERRQHNANYFESALKNLSAVQLPQSIASSRPSYLKYTIINRSNYSSSRIFEEAARQGIEMGNFNWQVPIHRRSPFQKLIAHDPDSLKNSEYLAKSIIQLPTHLYVTETHREKIVNLLMKFT